LSSVNSGTYGSAGKCLISGGNNDLCKLGEEYSNASICKFLVYSLQHSETFDVSHVFLPLTIAELSTLKQVLFFWPTLYMYVADFQKLGKTCKSIYYTLFRWVGLENVKIIAKYWYDIDM